MEGVYENQRQLFEAMSKIASNMKKDSADRKSVDYFRRRSETLEAYWSDYQYNHDRLATEGSRTHPYFIKNEYEQANVIYKTTKALIHEQQQAFVKRAKAEPAGNPGGNISQQGEYTRHIESEGADQSSDDYEDGQPSVAIRTSRGSCSKLDDMLKRQASNFRAFQRSVSGIDLIVLSQKWELEDALHTLQSRWSIIDSLHLELDSELEGTDVAYEASYTKHEHTYIQMKKAINSKLWSVAHREHSTPKSDIPIFNGNYQTWTSFKDLFIEAIHSNIAMSDAQKMQFLKGKLRGEAERLVQHLSISSENYSIAWEILNNRYNNIRLLFSTYANTLLNIPTTQQTSARHIKMVHDTAQECLNAIKKLGVDTSSWDPFIVHILLQKLDTDTHNQFLDSLRSPKNLFNLQDFLQFLEHKFTTLESSRKKPDILKSSNNTPHNIPNNKTFRTNNYHAKQSLPTHKVGQFVPNNKSPKLCPLCKDTHGLYFCNKFLNLTPQEKRNTISKLHLCENCLYDHKDKACLSEKRCRECHGNHNTLLHDAFRNLSVNIVADPQDHDNRINEILLATAMIDVQARDGSFHRFRALIDQGSQVSIISEHAAQRLALSRKRNKGLILGVGAKESNCKGVTNISFKSVYSNFSFSIEAYIMNKVINNLPSCSFRKPEWSHLENIQLSDPDFNIRRPVEILLGADVYPHIILDGISRSDKDNLPIAQQTRLGWILCGKTQTLHCNVVVSHMDDIQQFWEIEDISNPSSLSEEDELCVAHYNSTTTRRDDGSYEVRYPFKQNLEEQLGDSRNSAIAQFLQLERKFKSDNSIEQQYKTFINEYIALKHMRLSTGNQKPTCFLPHHCVIRSESSTTALRVVFNASRKTNTGCSLNDLMLKGPNLQQDLQSLLLKWRQFRYAFTADIEKMFRCIWVHEQDQKLQKIIWRNSSNSAISEYQLCTVTYGTKAAPFLAMMTLKRLADDERSNYQDSESVRVLQESFYMDDVLHGADTVESALQLQQDLIQLLKSGGFNLRKWKSNCPLLLPKIETDQVQNCFDFKQAESSKTLGLQWNPKQDLFSFQARIKPQKKIPTKRSMLSDLSKLFDPLGWLSPISTKLKILFQRVWMANIGWDDKLPEEIIKDWINTSEDMNKINQFSLERWLGTSAESRELELHGFCDSSNKAYACVIYSKINVNGVDKISLVASKARLVPSSKTISLPRLELSGALLLSKLMHKVQKALNKYSIKTHGWVDSMVVLAWIQGNPGRWKQFVANRVRQITEIMPPSQWRYVKSAENPADCASRGMSVQQLKEHSLWWKGPSWLLTCKDYQKDQSKVNTTEEVAKSKTVCYASEENNILGEILTKYGSFQKIIRILSWILTFIDNIKCKQNRGSTYITSKRIHKAKHVIIKFVQQTEFANEINNLKQQKLISSKSKLLQLDPFLDKDGLLRVGGRLRNANIHPDMMHPIILPHTGTLTELIIDDIHKITLHGGARVTLATIRQKYWIIGGNRAVKKRLHTCVTCRKNNPAKLTQLMGDLPSPRCNVAKPFYYTGIDFTGHVYIKANKGRGIKTTKGYIAVFVCMVTKLIHLELVSDLSSSSFMAALRRMAARKGSPRHLYCDNGTNFVGACNIMKQEFRRIIQTFDQNFISDISNMEIEWHFNAPAWPSAGGLWEAAVKSVKYHLRRVIGEQRLTFEEFSTILAQIEAVLNSRPLCPLTEDVNDLEILTPSSFINLSQSMTILETETDMRTRWHLTQKIVQDVWRRWRAEYLTQLASRSKWTTRQPNIQINDVVTINDTNMPPGKWALGRVVELHPGVDGYVRVVTLKTKNGHIKRPVTRLSLLPINDRIKPEVKQDNVSEHKPVKTHSKRRGYSHVSVITLLLLLFGIIGTCQCSFNTTLLNDDQGFYLNKISDMALIRDEWKIISYYDLKPYWQGTQACNKYIKYLLKICDQYKNISHCEIISMQLQHEYSELEYYNHLLLNQHSSTRQNTRQRRGLIDGVGYLANSLFGVLDARFAEQYKNDIHLIQYNQNHLATLIKNQTSVLEVEFNVLKRTEDSINKQHKMLNYLSLQLEKLQNALKTEQQINLIHNDFTLGAIAANNMLRQLSSIQENLLDTVTDIYHGRFNFHLISPEQLRETLSTISSHLTKDLSLPIKNLHTDLRKIYSLLKVKARMTEEYLLFELRVPLVTRDAFEIVKILPIPHAVDNGSMVQIVPIADYVAINLMKDSYIILYEQDITSCLHDESDIFLCYLQRPIYHFKNNDNLCKLDDSTKRCKVSYTTCTNRWTEIKQINQYLYFCCEVCQIRTLCENLASMGKIQKSGIISIAQGCYVKTDDFTVYAHNEGSNKLFIKNQFYTQGIEPINHVINVSIPTALLLNYSFNSNEKQFDTIKRQIAYLKENEGIGQQISYHDVHHYTVIYVILAIATVIAVIMVARKIRSKRSRHQEDSVVGRVKRKSSQSPAAYQSSDDPPKRGIYSVSESVECECESDSAMETQCQSVYSEIPKVRKVDRCTTPVPRRVKFI